MVSAKASPSSAALAPVEAPRRRFDCSNYCTCLDLAAALNWDNFTCRGCSGDIDEALLWRARQALRKDDIARKVCDLPAIEVSDKATTCNEAAANLNEGVNAQAPNRQAAEVHAAEIHAAEIHAAEIHGAGVHEAGVFESTGKIANPAGGACKINAKNLTLAPKR